MSDAHSSLVSSLATVNSGAIMHPQGDNELSMGRLLLAHNVHILFSVLAKI
jgi:hypothetical protein